VAGGIAAFLGCLATVVFLIWMLIPPKPVAVFLVGADYATNLAVPHNVPGWKGLEGIKMVSEAERSWAFFNPAKLELIGEREKALNPLDYKGDWDALITNLGKKRIKAPTLLIVVALHGGSRPEGAYLMPNKIASPEEGLDLKDVIESMRTKLPPEQNKILVLEGAQVSTAWRLGMVHNDFARQLKELEPKIEKVPNLWVLSGCDVNQRCWASEALGRTIFTHYIIEALQGAAGGSDRRLTLDDLYQYVQKNVRDWAWNARGALQEPQLLPGPGGKGASPGRTDPKRVYLALSTTAPALAAKAALDDKSRSDIQAAWKAFHGLETNVPRPTVYSPRRWREYRATLVRYEELLRAGAVSLANDLRDKKLEHLERNLKKERFLEASSPLSAELNLAMNALQGGAVEPTAPTSNFNKFLNASPADAKHEWEADGSSLATKPLNVDWPRSPRSRVQELLIKYAAGELTTFNIDDVSRNLKQAADRLATIKGSQLFSAEAHFLRMLNAHLNAPELKLAEKLRLSEAVKKALLVRRQAERAALAVAPLTGDTYHYSEQIQPWIHASIVTADEKRRNGEDLLFSSAKSDWQDAGTALDKAGNDYNRALDYAGQIRAALDIRDRVLAGLPDYSRWLPFHEDKTGALTTLIRDLWDKTHKLSDLLEKDNVGDPQGAPDIQKRAALCANSAEDIRKNFEAVEDRFQTHVGNLVSTRTDQDWEAAVAAAAVAFPDNETLNYRNAILHRLDTFRTTDITVAKHITERRSTIKKPDEPQAKLAGQRSQRRAGLQAMMALVVLGESWFKEATVPGKKGVDEYKVAKDYVDKLRSGAESESESWWKDAEAAGELIGQRWRGMSRELDPSQFEQITDYARIQARLVRLDRLSRQIDGGAEPPLPPEHEWTTRLRVTRVHDVLRRLADRTWEDHWFNEKLEDPPPNYYQAAVSNLLNESKALLLTAFPNIQAPKKDFDFKGEFALELQGPDPIVLTSEQDASAAYRIIEKNGLPKQGIPVVKPEAGEGLQLREVSGGIPEFRTASRQRDDPPIKVEFYSPILKDAEEKQGKTDSPYTKPEVTLSTLIVKGFFRGQIFKVKTPLQIHPVAGLVAIGPPPVDPPDALVAVKSNKDIVKNFGQGSGSIAIVLDCSGSMKYNEDKTQNEKLTNARNAITRVLKDVPRRTTVSLWTFSHLPQDILTDAQGNIVNPDARFTQLKAEPELTIERLREPSPWDPNQIDGLRTKLDGLRPWFETPLVEAMVTAARTDLIKAKGMKTLLVLTDGDDNRFEQSKALAPDRLKAPDIPAFITSYFKTLGITINMVFLCTNEEDKELKKARENFAKTLENVPPGGSFVSATDVKQLTQRLSRALRQELVYDILKPDLTVVQQSRAVSGEQENDSLDWGEGLKPGIYWIRVRADHLYQRRVELEPGDRLIVQLVDDMKDGIGFERGLYGDEPQLRSSTQRNWKDWRLAAMARQTMGEAPNRRLRWLTTLEFAKSPIDVDVPLRQAKPRLTWFDLNADGNQPPAAYSLRWHEQIKYPAPAWLLEVPPWVEDPAKGEPAKPILGAWWSKPDSELQSRDVPFVVNAHEYRSKLPQSVKNEGDTVTIEGLDIEEHKVEARSGAPPQNERCLVIRLSFPKDRPYIVDPVRVRLAGLGIAGYEHRLYTQANKYTGLFWPVIAEELSQLKGLNLISIADFQKQAKTLEYSIADMKLPVPRPDINDKTPDPIELPPAANSN